MKCSFTFRVLCWASLVSLLASVVQAAPGPTHATFQLATPPDLIVKDMVFKKFVPSSPETFGRNYDLYVTIRNNGEAVKKSFYVRVLVVYAGPLSTDPNKFAWLMVDPDKKTNVSSKQILSLGKGEEQTWVWKNAVQEGGQGYSPILYIAVVDCPTSKAEAACGAVAEKGGLVLASAPMDAAEKNNTLCVFPPAK